MNTKRALMAIAATALICTACKKEIVSQSGSTGNQRVIVYAIGGDEARITVNNDSEWNALLDTFCHYAQQGDTVKFYNVNNHQFTSPKSTVTPKTVSTFSTTSRERMIEWMKQMEKDGKTVNVTYDDNTHTWNGIAYSTMPMTHNDSDSTVCGLWRLTSLTVTELGNGGDYILNITVYVPAENETYLYHFYNNGVITTTSVTANGTTTANGSWSISDNGEICSDMLVPGNGCWSINWLTNTTMIISMESYPNDGPVVFYQMQFEAVI